MAKLFYMIKGKYIYLLICIIRIKYTNTINNNNNNNNNNYITYRLIRYLRFKILSDMDSISLSLIILIYLKRKYIYIYLLFKNFFLIKYKIGL